MNQQTAVKNEKPRIKAGTETQGKAGYVGNSKSTTDKTLKESRTRYEKGLELYRAGAVTINPSGHGFKVLGFTVDTEKVSCDCPEKKPCLHYYAATAFQKNGKPETQKVVYREGNGHDKPQNTPNTSNSAIQARSKDFISPRVKLRLSCLNAAVEVLRTWDKPITSKNLFKVAGELENWAMGVSNG